MRDYRCFFLRSDGSIQETEIWRDPDDLAALERARSLHRTGVVEGWDAARLVFRLAPDNSPA